MMMMVVLPQLWIRKQQLNQRRRNPVILSLVSPPCPVPAILWQQCLLCACCHTERPPAGILRHILMPPTRFMRESLPIYGHHPLPSSCHPKCSPNWALLGKILDTQRSYRPHDLVHDTTWDQPLTQYTIYRFLLDAYVESPQIYCS